MTKEEKKAATVFFAKWEQRCKMIHPRLSPRVPKVSIKNALNLTNGFFLDPERDVKAEEAKAARFVIEKINEFYKKEGENHHRFDTFMDALHQEIESTLFPPKTPKKPRRAACAAKVCKLDPS